LLNPKVIIFFLAYFPQFVDTDRGHPELQMLQLGTLFVLLVFMIFGTLAGMAGYASEQILTTERIRRLRWLGVWVCIGLAINLARSTL